MSEALHPGPEALHRAPEPLPFHRLLRALPRYRWWKPLVALVVAGVLWILFTVVVVLIGVVIAGFSGQLSFTSSDVLIGQLTKLFGVVDAGNPLSVSIGLLGVATLMPAVWIGYLVVGLRPLTVLRSVQFRLRWGWLGFCLLPALAVTLLATVVQFLIFPLFQGEGGPVAPTIPLGTFLLCVAIIIVVTPLQAAAEEFAFRGLITQMIGSWIRPVWLVIVLAAIPFAAAHTQYLGWATADVVFFALTAGFVTWRTGGIEAGIALHAINNTVAFVTLASSLGGTTSTSSSSTGDPLSFSVTVVTMGLYAFWVDRAARRRGLQNRLVPTVVEVPAA